MSTVAKRVVDVVGALLGLALLAIVSPLIAVAIRIDTPGPIFYRAVRRGQWGRPLRVTKFRSMRHGVEAHFNEDGSRLVGADDDRVTTVGRMLRGGLDELPQLVRVLTGEMSLVGPRPDDLFAIEHYSDADWVKLSVPSGMTGLAQVSGRTDISWAERLRYESYYAAHRSMSLDLKILVRTLATVVGRPPRPPVPLADADRYHASTEAAELGRSTRSACSDLDLR